MEQTMLDFVLTRLDAQKGNWRRIARDIEPRSWESYYSWLTKLAQRKIPDPGVNKVQELHDYFVARASGRKSNAAGEEGRGDKDKVEA